MTSTTMRLNALAAAASLALVSTMVLRTTDAAFSAQTVNSANEFDFATIALADNDNGTVMFDVADMVPEDSITKCIRVTYTGSVDVDVNVWSSDITDGDSVAQHLDMTIEEGVAASGALGVLTCDTFVADGAAIFTNTLDAFATTNVAHGSGVGTWAPSTTGTKDYRIVVTLGSDTPDSAQGGSVTSVEFTWEAQTT